MKHSVLQLSQILIPEIRQKLAERYTLYRYFEQQDKAAFLRQHGSEIQGVVTGGHTGISRELMEQLPNLKVIAINGVGTDAVDLAYAKARGITVTATIGALTEDVADLAIGLLIASCRGICTADRFTRAGLWSQSSTPLAPLPLAQQFSGMRVGIVGLGRIGRAIAHRASAFGCPIGYTDLHPMHDVPYTYEPDLISLAKNSDALIVSAAADQAEGIINMPVLEALGPQGYLINIARGRVVNEDDLVSALNTHRIAGAGLDVFVDEPYVPETLFDLEQVVLQPHRASATLQTRTKMGEMVLASLAEVFAGRTPTGLVGA